MVVLVEAVVETEKVVLVLAEAAVVVERSPGGKAAWPPEHAVKTLAAVSRESAWRQRSMMASLCATGAAAARQLSWAS